MSGHLTVQEAAARLRQMDNVLLLTHVRPDGDTIGCAAALCQALRDTGKAAYLLYNPEITATYAPCAAPYWAPEGFAPEHVVSTDIAALNLLPDNAAPYAGRIELAIDHHGSQAFFATETCLDAEAAACGEIIYHIIRALTAVTNLVIPFMAAGGHILNVSSIASFCPNPRMTVYSASKAYVSSFTVGLSEELRRKHISVTAVCPGPMRTEFLDVGNITGKSRTFELLPYCEQVQVAGGALRAARAGRTIYTPKLFYKFYRCLAKITPVKLMVKITKT